ncbi:hypothetical protein PAGU2595_027660 [Lysobacter xanthus]
MERYWARAEAKALRSVDRLDPASWFDLWHTHLDWYGRGNSCSENRLMVNAAAVRVLQYLERRLAARTEPVQVWADLSQDTANTGIYAHSENPNGSPFPVSFPNVVWGQLVPEEVAGAVPPSHMVGTASHEGRAWYIVQRRPNNSSKPTPLRGAA